MEMYGRLESNARDSQINLTVGCKKPRGRKQPSAKNNLALGKRASGETRTAPLCEGGCHG